MSDTLKTIIAAAAASITTALQCVIGFANLGAQLGVVRTIFVITAGLVVLTIIFAWVVAVNETRRRRRIVSITATILTTVITISLLWLTYALHSIVLTRQQEGPRVTTRLRAPLTSTEVTMHFTTSPPAQLALVGFRTYDRLGAKKVHVEHEGASPIYLHAFQYPQRFTVVHESAAPITLREDTDNKVTFTTPAAIQRHVLRAALLGGLLCVLACLSLWLLSRSPRPADRVARPIGFPTTASPSTPPPDKPSAASPPRRTP